jgi:hypothetical protein
MPIAFSWTGASVLLSALALAGCQVVPPEPLSPAEAAEELSARRLDPESLAAALRRAELPPLSHLVQVPPPPEEGATPRDLWRAAAIAWNPRLREARLRAAQALAATGGAGRPLPHVVGAEGMEIRDGVSEIAWTFDLLAILGAAPSEAARALATAEARSAIGALEAELWALLHDLDRALLRVETLQAIVQDLSALESEVEPDRKRTAILFEAGWIPRKAWDGAEHAVLDARSRRARLEAELAERRLDLLRLAGLDPGAVPAWASVPGPDAVPDPRPEAPPEEPAGLVASHPRLRRLLLEYAVAEAALQEAASRSFPELRLGPGARITPQDLFLGPMLEIAIPDGARVEAGVAAARAARASAREAVVTGLAELRSEIAAKQDAVRIQKQSLEAEGVPLLDRARRIWRAERTDYRSIPGELERWTMALDRLARAIEDVGRHRLEVRLLALDLEEARGPDPSPAELAAAGRSAP